MMAGGPISKKTTQQNNITISTAEAELVIAVRPVENLNGFGIYLLNWDSNNRGSQCWALLIFHNILVAGG